MIEFNTEGSTPTAALIRALHTGKLRELLPGIFIIKGAKNEQGFDQGYGILSGKKELVLIDVVEEAYKEAVEYLRHEGYHIRAILITSKTVQNDVYTDLATLSEEAGGAEIYIHPDIAPDDFETKDLTQRDALLSIFDLEPKVVPNSEGQVVLYCDRHNGIIFAGDSAIGSDYGSDELEFIRERKEKEKFSVQVEEFWQGLTTSFDSFFSRKGKPAIELDGHTRTSLLDRLAHGEAG